jgi:hypothetical protein
VSKSIPIIILTSILVACSNSPYHVELDPLSKQQTVPKYGEGNHYFVYSKHRFSSNNNSEQKDQYIRDIEAYIQENMSATESCKIIKETLSYYGESGNVSILVVCRGT